MEIYVHASLTPRERQVAASLAAGYVYKHIANELGISINTVRTHVKAIYRKAGVNRRYHLSLNTWSQR